MDSETLRIAEIFQPIYAEKYKKLKEENARLVHYCGASVALKIIRQREVWMRNVSCMNDFSEVQHGLGLLHKCYRSESGDRFKAVIDSIEPGAVTRFEGKFDGWAKHLLFNTFVTCFSEHLPQEDKLGRLSMWRAYGRGSGIAFVLNNTAMISESNALNAFTSPVAYLTEPMFEKTFNLITENIAANESFVREHLGNDLADFLFWTFVFAVVSAKHPGFLEEQEWRVIHVPTIAPSSRLIRSIEDVAGSPQVVYKIPLQNIPDEGLFGMEPNELIERIIVGPSDNALVIAEALRLELENAGVEDPFNRVVISDIPLRQ